MKIGMLDVDGHNFPNLAQMKISAWHKAQGDDVERLNPMMRYDKVYVSKVFSFTPDYDFNIMADKVIHGGTGYAWCGYEDDQEYVPDFYACEADEPLPYEIEHTYPDYSLYGITDTAYGFLTRGCPRGCEFCIVSSKEGMVARKVADLSEFWIGQKHIKLLDPNLLACKDQYDLLESLVESKAKVDFTQGLDPRLLDERNTDLIKRIKPKRIHFAMDFYKNVDQISRNLKMFMDETKYNHGRVSAYVLTNFDTTLEQDIERVEVLKSLDIHPYVMIYNKHNLPKNHILKKLQRYTNIPMLFWSKDCSTFEDYKKRMGIS